MASRDASEYTPGLRPSQEKDFPYFRRLFNSIVVALLAASFIPMILIGGGMYYYTVSMLEEKTLANLRMEIREHRKAIDQFLAERTTDLKLLASNLGREHLTGPGALETVFHSLQEREPCFTDLGIIDDQGRHLAYVGPYDLISKNYKEAPWFRALQEREVYISDVFLGFRKEPHFIIAVKEKTPDGFWIIRATVDTAYFDNMVSEVLSERSGDAFLVNMDGVFQTSPRKTGQLTGQWALERLKPFEGVKLEEREGRLLMMAWQKEVPWLCVAEFDRDEIYKPLHRIRNVGIFVFVLGAILIVLTVLLTTNYLFARLEKKRRSIRFLDHQLRHTSKVASSMQLASGFARDMKDTLSNIDLVASWIWDLSERDLSKEQNRNEIRESLNQIKSEVARTREITDKFLRTTQRTVPIIREIRINDLLNDIVELLDRELHFNRIAVARDYQDELPAVRSDPSQLRQVFQNLILNAMTAIRKDGEIALETRAGKESVTVSVTDTGPGIPEEHMQKIFDPLFTTRPEGTGLGLSISADTLRRLGGRISVKNEPGKGASFTVELPLQFKPSTS